MTTQEKDLIRESFEVIRELSEPVCLLFYGRLFDLDPSLRRLFHTDMKIQSKKLIDMLAVIVDGLEHFDKLRPQLQELGRRHTEYGAKDEHYDTLGAALLWAFGQALHPHFYPETRAVWLSVIQLVNSEMKRGAAQSGGVSSSPV